MFVANNENAGKQYNENHCQYILIYVYVSYVRPSIFTPVFALNFVVSLMEQDGFTSSGQTKVNAEKGKSRHQIYPENMLSTSETSIFTTVFRDNRWSYPFSL